ncbi:hypothetical protein F5876DRAFT_79246 [Lentinula aff. lateritia]|uniref:Uncharacterized protein n=1 Tax=Lentinula aff. lateritia TaxID=2804960 RepID=A0ACC1TTE9_9AGAR|nr:hypothetical protein F5876DRAFT_79246 [Lentinula aff. lateritia]
MSDGQQQQQGEESSFSPALPPAGSTTEQAARLANEALQSVADRVTEGRILPEAGRTSIRTYLETVFRTFQLGAEYSLGDSLKPWLEFIDNHEWRLAHAEREGRRREPQRAGNSQRVKVMTENKVTRLGIEPRAFWLYPRCSNQLSHLTMGVEALLAGLPRSATRGDDSPDQQHSQGDTNPPPTLEEPGGGNDAQQTRPDGLPGDGMRREEENPRGETRTQPMRATTEDRERDQLSAQNSAKQDKSLFNWAADAFIKQSVLSLKHRKVIQEIENFKLDIDEAIKSIKQSGVNPIFPKKLWKSVLRNEYVELAEVHALVATYHHPEAPQPTSNKFAKALELSTLAKLAPTKAIVDQTTWCRAWRATADAISFAFTNCLSTGTSSTTTKLCTSSSALDATSSSTNPSTLRSPDLGLCTSFQPEHTSRPQRFRHPDQIKGICILATGPRRFAGSSIGEAVMGANEGTFAPHAENQDTEHKSAENRPPSFLPLLERRSGLLFPSPGDEYKDIAEKSEGKMHGIESGSEEGRRDKMEGKGIGEGSTPSLPRFMRGLGFREDVMVLHSRTVSFTESDDPLVVPAVLAVLVDLVDPIPQILLTSPMSNVNEAASLLCERERKESNGHSNQPI